MVPRRILADILRSPKYPIELAAVAVVYFAAAKLCLTLASIHPNATPIWPPTGLALAAILLCGHRIWPAIFAGAFLVNLTTAGSIYTSCAIGFGNTLEAVIGGWLINRWSDGRNTFETPIGVAKFTLIGLGPSTMTSATIGVGSLSLAGYADLSNFAPVWMTWWLGDLAGALVVTPVIVLWSAPPSLDRDQLLRSAMILATALAVGIVAFSPLFEQTADRAALAFLAILPLIWAALRAGPRDTATVALILACFAVWGTVMEGGPFARSNINDSFLLVLAFMISISVPSLALSADVAMRRSADDRERFIYELSDQLRNIADPDRIMTRVAGAIGRYLAASRAGYSEIDVYHRASPVARGAFVRCYRPVSVAGVRFGCPRPAHARRDPRRRRHGNQSSQRGILPAVSLHPRSGTHNGPSRKRATAPGGLACFSGASEALDYGRSRVMQGAGRTHLGRGGESPCRSGHDEGDCRTKTP